MIFFGPHHDGAADLFADDVVVADDVVAASKTTGSGFGRTGAVVLETRHLVDFHLAPGFGDDDQRICEEAGIPVVVPVDDRGRFTDEVPDFAGLQVFEANTPIIRARN